jgi:hypothetical protein
LAKGDFQWECADLYGISQPLASKSIHSVLVSLNAKIDNVKFPTSFDEVIRTKTQFYDLAKLPGVIDGKLIPIFAWGLLLFFVLSPIINFRRIDLESSHDNGS